MTGKIVRPITVSYTVSMLAYFSSSWPTSRRRSEGDPGASSIHRNHTSSNGTGQRGESGYTEPNPASCRVAGHHCCRPAL